MAEHLQGLIADIASGQCGRRRTSSHDNGKQKDTKEVHSG